MAQNIISSQLVADTITAVQLFTTDSPRLLSITLKARAGNAEGIYVADDSAAKSSGFEILAGDAEDKVFHPITVKATSVWVWGASSGDRLDYWALLEE